VASPRFLTTRRVAFVLSGSVLIAAHSGISAALAAGTPSTVSGGVFYDDNRDGFQNDGEAPVTDAHIYLVDSSNNIVANTLVDAAGHYSLGGISDGTYQLEAETNLSSHDWVPTTTGSILPLKTVTLSGSTITQDFGYRQIVRSTTAGSPISSYTGGSGLTVESYDDVVPATTIYDDLMQGALVGPEAKYVTIRFDLNDQSVTATSVAETNGVYSNYRAYAYVSYQNWHDTADNVLFHEYGHAWSWYYAYIVQQDPNFTGYLQARGLSGDTRVGSQYQWMPAEMIAEDYRQLFGTASAASYQQMNQYIPAAGQVAGLKSYLSGTFMTGPGSASPSPSPSPSPSSTPTSSGLSVSGLSVTPSPVVKSGTVAYGLSSAASVTVTIRDPAGGVVRTLVSSANQSSGSHSMKWDRKNSTGQRVKSGTYTAEVDATAAGVSTSAQAIFQVS
jgi:hypothetical protein